MNYLKHILSRLALCAAILYCMTPLSPAVLAAEQAAGTNEICIEVKFPVSNREYTEQDYQDVVFIVQNSRKEYLVAEYDQAMDAYIPTGHTSNFKDATCFRCSCKDSSSGRLMIVGLEENCYTITNCEVPSGCAKNYNYGIIVCFSDTTAFVDGWLIDNYDGQTVKFTYNVYPEVHLPMYKSYDTTLLYSILLILYIVALLFFIFYILTHRQKSDSEKSQE